MLPTYPVQGIIIQVYIRLSQLAFRSTAIISSHKVSSGGMPFLGIPTIQAFRIATVSHF